MTVFTKEVTTPTRPRRIHGLPLIELTGDVDGFTAPALQSQLLRLVETGDADLLISLSSVGFIDSLGIGMLVAVHGRAAEQGGSLRVLCDNRSIYRALEVAGLTRAFPVYRDETALSTSLDAK